MKGPWRPAVIAAAFCIGASVAGVAEAQKVIVRKAPPGTQIEVLLNQATVASGKADAAGESILDLRSPAGEAKGNAVSSQISVHVYVDSCSDRRRVLLVQPGAQVPALPEGCTRKDITGTFVTRPETTFLVDVGPQAAVWLRQGPAPYNWYGEGATRSALRSIAPTGLGLFGAVEGMKFADTVAIQCGDVGDCSGRQNRAGWVLGVDEWFTRFIGAEASYTKSARVTANGYGSTFRFGSYLDPRIVTLAGKVGFAAGRVRLYGKGGANYHRALLSTTETIDPRTVTVDSTAVTIPGGTQTITTTTAGWGWLIAGGLEAWVSPRWAIYFEGQHDALKGSSIDEGSTTTRETVNMLLIGARIHVF